MAQLYARFAKAGKVFGDAQIDAIDRAERLRRQLLDTPITEAVCCPELTAMLDRQLVYIRDYFC